MTVAAWILVFLLLTLAPFWGCCCGTSGGSCCVKGSVGGCAGFPVASGVNVDFIQGGVTVGSSTTNSAGLTSAVCLTAAATTVSVSSPPARFAANSIAYTLTQVAAGCSGSPPLGVPLSAASGYSCYCGQIDYVPTKDTLFLTDSFYSLTVTLTRTGSNAGGGIWTGSASVGMVTCGGFGGCSAGTVNIDYTFWQFPGNIFVGPYCVIAASPSNSPVGGCTINGASAGSPTGGLTYVSPAPGLVITATSGTSNLYRSAAAGSCVDNATTYTITE